MGHFLASTAFRSNSTTDTVDAISAYLRAHDVKHEALSSVASIDEATDALVFAPQNEWVVVLWPNYFNIYDFRLAAGVGATHPWLISSVHVYDGDYWEHLAVHGTRHLHTFCSRPGYWASEPSELERLNNFHTDPKEFASATNVSSSVLQPYLVDVDGISDETSKAHADDAFPLVNIWVFTDFWRQAGIVYPDPPSNPATVVRLSKWFSKRLPHG